MIEKIRRTAEIVASPTKASDTFLQSRALTPLEKVGSVILGGLPKAAQYGFLGTLEGGTGGLLVDGVAILLGIKTGAVLGAPFFGLFGAIGGAAIGACVGAVIGARGELRAAQDKKQQQTS